MKLLLLFFLSFSVSLGFSQDSIDVSMKSNSAFLNEYNAMVDSLNMSESVAYQFHEIYKVYGETMREAYENRTSWSGLNHVYQWAKNDRDSKMKSILDENQFYYFKKQQAIIESNARKRKSEASKSLDD